MNDDEIKRIVRKEFSRNYAKYYPVKALKDEGFERYVCKRCKKAFWSREPADVCEECKEKYEFIGRQHNRIDYFSFYKKYAKYMQKFGYKDIFRYPVVARWADFPFVFAGINIFQPHVVEGNADPIAKKTIEQQFCLRFDDIDDTGINSKHYTGFIMVGQHEFLKARGKKWMFSPLKILIGFFDKLKWRYHLKEDVWVGAGNFGPSLESFAGGLELSNQVYMQFKWDKKPVQLRRKIIDMGAGLERWAWYSSGASTSYEAVMPKVVRYLFKAYKPSKLWRDYAPYSLQIDVEERPIDESLRFIAEKLGCDFDQLKEEVLKVGALLSIADHTRSLLVAIHDGALPSNVGGGYNLRNLIRRIFSFIDYYDFDVDLIKIFELQMREFGKYYKLEPANIEHLPKVLEIERKKYKKAVEQAKKIAEREVKRGIDLKRMIFLYETYGVTPEMLKDYGVEFSNFYTELAKLKKGEEKEKRKIDVSRFPKTKKLYWKNAYKFKFKAKVLGYVNGYVVLDKTCFYPRSGGQDCDTGKLNDANVSEVIEVDGVVLHKVDKKVKGEVIGIIDEERRLQLMKHHTAVHILGIACKEVLGRHAMQAGTEKTVEKARLDVMHYELPSFDQIQAIEMKANEIIWKALPVEIKFMRRSEAEAKYGPKIYAGGAVPGNVIRIVKVDDDVQACGGTHVKRTNEIELLKIFSCEKVKDGVIRFEIVAGERAKELMLTEEKILHNLMRLWNVTRNEIYKTALRFFEEWKEQRKELKEANEKLAFTLAQLAVEKGEKEVEIPTDELGLLIAVAKKYPGILLIGKNVGYGINVDPALAEKRFAKVIVEGNAVKCFSKRI